MRALLIAMVGLVVGLVTALPGDALVAVCGDPPYESDCVINNGWGPPVEDNLIYDTSYGYNAIIVRNVGCPPGWPSADPYADCPSPGAATDVVMMDGGGVDSLIAKDSSTITMSGGDVATVLEARDFSSVTMTGGGAWGLGASDFSSVTMSGGYVSIIGGSGSATFTMSGGHAVGAFADGSLTLIIHGHSVWISGGVFARDSSTVVIHDGFVGGDIAAQDSSTVTIDGGEFWGGGVQSGEFVARQSSRVRIVGTDFEVDGIGVPYGDLTAQTGTLTGTLAMGDPINGVFYQGGWTESRCTVSSPCSGTITLLSPSEVCGDGVVEGSEACDDDNIDSGDGCSETCQIEEGWECSGEPSVCATIQLPALSPWSQLALMVGLLGAGLGVWRGWRSSRSVE